MPTPKRASKQHDLQKSNISNILHDPDANHDVSNQNPEIHQGKSKQISPYRNKPDNKQLQLQKAYLKNINIDDIGENKFKNKFKQIVSHRPNPIKTLSPKNIQNLSQTFRITKGVKFNKAKRYLSQIHYKQSDPSPDQYKHEIYQKNRNSPKFSFGKQQKFFKTRKQLKCKTQIPGPGKYRSFSQNHNGKLTIPHSERFQSENSKENPGVGQYQIQKPYFKHTISIKFPQQRRKSLENANLGPGPNKYFIEQKAMRSTNQSFNRQKKLELIDEKVPGVGEYSIDRFKQKHSPHARFPSTGLKDSRYKKSEQLEPGPGEYNACPVEKYRQHSKIVSVKFNKADKTPRVKQLLPGPANYNISQKRMKIKGGVITGRCKYQCTQQIPGPASYEPNFNAIGLKSITARMGRQLRMKDSKDLSPGPNDYHPEKAKINFKSTGFAFPKGKRQFF